MIDRKLVKNNLVSFYEKTLFAATFGFESRDLSGILLTATNYYCFLDEKIILVFLSRYPPKRLEKKDMICYKFIANVAQNIQLYFCFGLYIYFV